VAMSGGVDSAMAAHLLQQQGHAVTGIYMQNWDHVEETGICSGEVEWNDVQRIGAHLGIPTQRLNFVHAYWGNVFENMIQGYAAGETPNPDVWCNKEIKFGALYQTLFPPNQVPEFAYLATGTLAFTEPGGPDQAVELTSPVLLFRALCWHWSNGRTASLNSSARRFQRSNLFFSSDRRIGAPARLISFRQRGQVGREEISPFDWIDLVERKKRIHGDLLYWSEEKIQCIYRWVAFISLKVAFCFRFDIALWQNATAMIILPINDNLRRLNKTISTSPEEYIDIKPGKFILSDGTLLGT
jgi:hypothetical protein